MRRKLTLPKIVGISILAAFTLIITWRAKRLEKRMANVVETPTLVSHPAPPFSLSSLDGQQVSLSHYHGRKVVLIFWASWCGPCRLEMPELRSFYKRYHTHPDQFEFLAVSLDDNRAAAAGFATQVKIPFPVLLDPTGKVAKSYSVVEIPTVFVVDENGKIVFGRVGYSDMLKYLLASKLGIKLTFAASRGTRGRSSH